MTGVVEVALPRSCNVAFVEGSRARGRRARLRGGRAVDHRAREARRGRRREALGRIEAATDLDELAGVDLVIEAATEDRHAQGDLRSPRGGIEIVLASNTSSIPIRELGRASGRPDHVIGMHFFNPPPVMALLELTPSGDTSEETFAFVRDFGTDVLGKTCVQSGDEAGFIVNRLLIPYLFDAIRLYASGFATARTSTPRCGWGSPIRWDPSRFRT